MIKLAGRVIKLFPENSFYVITIHDSYIQLQGHYNSDVVLIALKYKFKAFIAINGFTELRRMSSVINITLS